MNKSWRVSFHQSSRNKHPNVHRPHTLDITGCALSLREAVPKEHSEIAQRVTLWQGGNRLIPRGSSSKRHQCLSCYQPQLNHLGARVPILSFVLRNLSIRAQWCLSPFQLQMPPQGTVSWKCPYSPGIRYERKELGQYSTAEHSAITPRLPGRSKDWFP